MSSWSCQRSDATATTTDSSVCGDRREHARHHHGRRYRHHYDSDSDSDEGDHRKRNEDVHRRARARRHEPHRRRAKVAPRRSEPWSGEELDSYDSSSNSSDGSGSDSDIDTDSDTDSEGRGRPRKERWLDRKRAMRAKRERKLQPKGLRIGHGNYLLGKRKEEWELLREIKKKEKKILRKQRQGKAVPYQPVVVGELPQVQALTYACQNDPACVTGVVMKVMTQHATGAQLITGAANAEGTSNLLFANDVSYGSGWGASGGGCSQSVAPAQWWPNSNGWSNASAPTMQSKGIYTTEGTWKPPYAGQTTGPSWLTRPFTTPSRTTTANDPNLIVWGDNMLPPAPTQLGRAKLNCYTFPPGVR